MREILFRGKDTAKKWHYGVPVAFSDKHVVITTPEARNNRVVPETVGQYTGLKDKNGERIFEGDIGRYKQTDGAKRNGQPIICTGKVIYNDGTASFAVESKDASGCEYFDYFPIKEFEIIGNIHDNPELLEVGNE